MAQIIPIGVDAVSGQAKQLLNNDDVLVTGTATAGIAWQLNLGGGQGLSIFGDFPVVTGNGGNVQIASGDGGPTSGLGGHVQISSGGSSTGVAGDIELTGGVSTTSLGGWIEMTGGDSGGTGIGGNIRLTGGNSTGTGIGGPIVLTAGDGGTTSGTGGRIDVRGGNASVVNNNGGSLDIRAGDAKGPTGAGGQTVINAGYHGGEGGTAGDLQLGSELDYTKDIVIGDAGQAAQQDLIVYANFMLDNGANSSFQAGNNTDAPGLILIDPGGIVITPNTGTVLEVGPTFYDPVNANLIRIGQSIFIDGDGTNNLIYGENGPVATNPGEQLYIRGGTGNTTGTGGLLKLEGGAGGSDGIGGVASLSGGAATGTNKTGTTTTVKTGSGTGTGAPGSVRIQTSSIEASGTTLQTAVDRSYVNGVRKTLTDNTPIDLFEIALPASAMTGGYVTYNIRASDGTDFQQRNGIVLFGGVNKAGAFTTSTTISSSQLNASTGTLAETWASTGGTNKITISLNADSSLTTTILDVLYTVHNESTQAVTIL